MSLSNQLSSRPLGVIVIGDKALRHQDRRVGRCGEGTPQLGAGGVDGAAPQRSAIYNFPVFVRINTDLENARRVFYGVAISDIDGMIDIGVYLT